MHLPNDWPVYACFAAFAVIITIVWQIRKRMGKG